MDIYYIMDLVKMPAVADYWKQKLRYEPIADKMGRNRFYKISQYLHFVDNEMVSEEQKKDLV